MFSTYAQILRHPGALLFSLTGLFARLQMSMAGLGATLLIVHYRDSYALAAQITAVFAVSAAVIGPQTSRLTDRFGQARIIPLQIAVHAPTMFALIYVATLQGHVPLMFVLALVAGASSPAIGSLIRARWSTIYTGTPQLRTAFAMESLIDEVVFITGPLLATFLALQVAPAAALLVATTILTVGSTLLVLQRKTQPIPTGSGVPAPKGSALFIPGVAAVAAIFIFMGSMFGSFEIVTIGYAEEQGVKGATGILLALYSLGSLVAGFVFGAWNFKASLPRQFLLAVTAVAVVTAPLSLMPNVWWLGLAALIAGLAIAPVLISGMSLVERIVPGNRLTESMTWVSGGLSVGLAGGMLLSGFLLDEYSAHTAYLVVSGSALLAFVMAGFVRRSVSNAFYAAQARTAAAPTLAGAHH